LPLYKKKLSKFEIAKFLSLLDVARNNFDVKQLKYNIFSRKISELKVNHSAVIYKLNKIFILHFNGLLSKIKAPSVPSLQEKLYTTGFKGAVHKGRLATFV
jgi:hypothetical protein